jgi:hypothetical protein
MVMNTLIIALKDMRDFLVLMLSYMIVTSILSTELFAYRVLYSNSSSTPLKGDLPAGTFSQYHSTRLNFDSFFDSFVSNFVVIVQDNWNNVMMDVYRATQNKVYLPNLGHVGLLHRISCNR